MKKNILISAILLFVGNQSISSSNYSVIDVNFDYLPNYSQCCAAWKITLSKGLGITTSFSDLELRGYSNTSCNESFFSYSTKMPKMVIKNISTGIIIAVDKMPQNIVTWKVVPTWILVNGIEFQDGMGIILDNGKVIRININNQDCQIL